MVIPVLISSNEVHIYNIVYIYIYIYIYIYKYKYIYTGSFIKSWTEQNLNYLIMYVINFLKILIDKSFRAILFTWENSP